MDKIEGLVRNIIKATIDGVEYVKITNLLRGELISPEGQIIINTTVYRKDNDGYEAVSPLEVSLEHRNKLSYAKTYVKMSDDEIKDFLNIIENQVYKAIEVNNFINCEEFKVGNVCDINYALTREKGAKRYSLCVMNIKSTGELKKQEVLTPNELPYVLIDIISKEPTLDNMTIVIAQNNFAHIHKEDNKIVVMIAMLDDSNAECGEDGRVTLALKCAGVYTIVENEGKYTFITDKESEVLYGFNNIKKYSILKELKENLDLE